MRGITFVGRLLLTTCLACGFGQTASFAALPSAETLLPATTRLFACIRNVKASRESLKKTHWGAMTDDPELKPFFDDLQQQIDARMADSAATVGLTVRDFKDLSDGQVAVAVVDLGPAPSGEAQTGTVVMVDVTGHDQQLAAVRGKLANALVQKQATAAPFASQAGAQGTKYDIPPQKEGGRPLVMLEAAQKLNGDIMWFVSDNPVLLEIVSAALGGGAQVEPLAKVDSFQKIMAQTKAADGEPAAGLAVFLDPLNLAFALRAYEYPREAVKPDPLEVLRNAGFDGIKGIGGQAVTGVGDFGFVARIAAIAPKPHQKSLQMFSFVKGNDFAPPSFVRANVTAYLTLYLDGLQAFNNFGPIFDGFLEDEGIWDEVVRSLATDEDGPKIDLRKEFFELLANRITVVVDKKEPLTEDSAQVVAALELKPGTEAKVLDTVKRAFANDDTVEKIQVDVPSGKQDVWRVTVQEEVPPQAANQEGVVDGMRVVADAFVAVGAGHLYIASDVDMLQKVLTPNNDGGLANAPDFVAVAEKMGGFILTLGKEPTIISTGFERSDAMMEIDYELFKVGRLSASKTVLGRIAYAVTKKAEEEGREVRKVDTSKLPPYDKIRKYLSPMGIVVNETPDGLFATAFSLEKGPAAAAPAAKK